MKLISKYVALIFSFITLVGCDSKYHKKNGKWHWKYFHGGSLKFVYTEIESIDHKEFQVISDSYGKDANLVFYKKELIPQANSGTFEVINNNGYTRDKDHVFLEGKIIIQADPKSFEILEFPYSKDNTHVFCGTLPLIMEKEEVAEFKVTKGGKERTIVLRSYFTELNPEYQWLDALGIDRIIVSEEGKGNTNDKKFKGFREIKK